MATEYQKSSLAGLHSLWDCGSLVGLTDGQLLERFARIDHEYSQLAFAALVNRHGPMVFRTCRSILRNEHDAEDAFQATFLILARKGCTLWVRGFSRALAAPGCLPRRFAPRSASASGNGPPRIVSLSWPEPAAAPVTRPSSRA